MAATQFNLLSKRNGKRYPEDMNNPLAESFLSCWEFYGRLSWLDNMEEINAKVNGKKRWSVVHSTSIPGFENIVPKSIRYYTLGAGRIPRCIAYHVRYSTIDDLNQLIEDTRTAASGFNLKVNFSTDIAWIEPGNTVLIWYESGSK